MPYITSIERSGMKKGRLEGIEACLEVKFGPDGLRLMPEINQIEDVEVLQAILQAIKTATSSEELRRFWSK